MLKIQCLSFIVRLSASERRHDHVISRLALSEHDSRCSQLLYPLLFLLIFLERLLFEFSDLPEHQRLSRFTFVRGLAQSLDLFEARERLGTAFLLELSLLLAL